MSSSWTRLAWMALVGVGAAGACTSELLTVPATDFWCDGNSAEADGNWPCPSTHWCREHRCVPRFGCVNDDPNVPGCKEDVRRCELFASDDLAATQCVSGLHTMTSTLPNNPSACRCPDGLYCVALATIDSAATQVSGDPKYPLFLLLPERTDRTLPIGKLGITGEASVPRLCTRVCSFELDCPAGYTCRVTAVLPNAPGEEIGARRTIGACYPNVLSTSTTATGQPEPNACMSTVDCAPSKGRTLGVCRATVEDTQDHPTVLAGDAWTNAARIATTCIGGVTTLAPDGAGCAAHNNCQSGVCSPKTHKCARLCDARDVESCGAGRACASTLLERSTASEGSMIDRIDICGI